MSYQDLTNDICRLVNDSNVWSSTIVIPDGDGVLDISSAANGANSSTPVSATNQPNSFPTGWNASFYRFDPDKYYGEGSWPALKEMITQAGCVSGCNISVRNKKGASALRKVMYCLRCSHGFLICDSGSVVYNGDNVGACNVITERLKCVNTTCVERYVYLGFLLLIQIRTC